MHEALMIKYGEESAHVNMVLSPQKIHRNDATKTNIEWTKYRADNFPYYSDRLHVSNYMGMRRIYPSMVLLVTRGPYGFTWKPKFLSLPDSFL